MCVFPEWGKKYFANSQEPEPRVFGPLDSEPELEQLEKKIPGARAAWDNNQEPPEPMEKKVKGRSR